MPMIPANGVTFHVIQAGTGPDVVMLHGLSGNLAVWHLKMVPMLSDEYRLTTYDLRGHGNSSMPPTGYSTRDMAGDLLALLDELKIQRPVLLGHSYGADIILHFALLHPDRVSKLVLIEPGLPALLSDRSDPNWDGWKYWSEVLERLTGEPVPAEHRNDISYLVRRSVELPIVFGPMKGLPRRKDRTLRLMDNTTMVADYEKVDELTLENLKTIPHPKLLLYDSGSAWLSTFKVLRNVLQNCTAELLPPADELRHFSPLAAPDQLVEKLRAFVGTSSPAETAAPTSVS